VLVIGLPLDCDAGADVVVVVGRHGGTHKFLTNLLRFKLIYHDGHSYDGALGHALR
jgi:hypothetical protein